MDLYKQRKNAKSVLALCFSTEKETYHHWRVFTRGSEGVCIEFKGQAFLKKLRAENNLRVGKVEYKLIKDLASSPPSDDDLPFLKRLPYAAEQEFRLVYLSTSDAVDAKTFGIDLSSIRRITLSPWMPRSLVGPVKTAIQSIAGCSAISVVKTTLLENEKWKEAALETAKSKRK